jgi:CspA family cold shock protein
MALARQSFVGRRRSVINLEGTGMAEGTIKKLTDKGFGFISTGGAKDLFFHSKALQGVQFDDLQEGQRVSFTEGRGPKGPCAENVKPI